MRHTSCLWFSTARQPSRLLANSQRSSMTKKTAWVCVCGLCVCVCVYVCLHIHRDSQSRKRQRVCVCVCVCVCWCVCYALHDVFELLVIQHCKTGEYGSFTENLTLEKDSVRVSLLCVRAWVRACVHACVHACVRACVHACVRACVRACELACVRACVHACMHTCVKTTAWVCMYERIGGWMAQNQRDSTTLERTAWMPACACTQMNENFTQMGCVMSHT